MNPLPNKKYQVIYADPPWKVQNASSVWYKCDNPIENKYPTMNIEEIKALPIKEISDKPSSLFLWTTHTFLKDALEVMESWGFKYHCCITWDKKSGFSVWGFHRRTEFCLFGYSGGINVNQKGRFIPTLIVEPKRKHSQKPILMRSWIENNSPKPRIELFARERFDGWDAWGNELPNTTQKMLKTEANQ